jgi:ligand-binding SRPBCC domain-containing protein
MVVSLKVIMRLYRLIAKQGFPIGTDVAWDFLSDPGNLQKITPPHMGFEILSGIDRKMYPGQIIQYSVAPFKGIRTRWVTEISHVSEGHYFVDEQRFGPYSLWHHKHFIAEVPGGTEMQDIIDYKPPMGILGRLAHTLFIRRQLTAIFQYRKEVLEERFGILQGYQDSLSIVTV